MTGPDIDLSVVKRRTASFEEVHERLEEQGFEHTGSFGDRVHYHENDEGFSITKVNGPFGTLLLPSGPVRGLLFGNRAVGFNIDRGVTDGEDNNSDNEESGSRGSTAERQVRI